MTRCYPCVVVMVTNDLPSVWWKCCQWVWLPSRLPEWCWHVATFGKSHGLCHRK